MRRLVIADIVGQPWQERRFTALAKRDAMRALDAVYGSGSGLPKWAIELDAPDIDADWFGSDVTLVPMPVVAKGEKPAPLATQDRGRQLFVAAGCVTCHVKTDDAKLGERKAISVGPVLTGRQFPVEWLVQKITDPASLRVGTGQSEMMPQLGLSQPEISALASYINYKQQAAVAPVGR